MVLVCSAVNRGRDTKMSSEIYRASIIYKKDLKDLHRNQDTQLVIHNSCSPHLAQYPRKVNNSDMFRSNNTTVHYSSVTQRTVRNETKYTKLVLYHCSGLSRFYNAKKIPCGPMFAPFKETSLENDVRGPKSTKLSGLVNDVKATAPFRGCNGS